MESIIASMTPVARPSRRARAAAALVLALGGIGPLRTAGGQARRPVPAAAVERPQPGVDVLAYAFDVALAPDRPTVEGSARITFARRAGTRALRLDALGFRAVTAEVAGRAVAASVGDSGIVVPLDDVAMGAAVDTLVATVRWQARPADGLILRGAGSEWTAFADHWPDRARHWLPVVDHPSDKATVQWTVRVPTGLRVVANGVPLSVDTVGGEDGATVTWRFRHAQLIPSYLMVVGVGALVEVPLGVTACGAGRDGGCVPQAVVASPATVAALPGTFAEAGEIVRFLSGLVGPFPYDRLWHVQSRTRFGGMENAGAIFYAWELFTRPAPFPAGLIAHETAHQWFGDHVTERAWGHVWLSEGFATYLAAMYTEHARGDTAFRAELGRLRREVMASPVSRTRPVLDTAETVLLRLLNTNSYQKGGLVLHLLRREIGDSAFVRAMRRYQRAHGDGTALTRDFQAACEAEAGRPLGWFFTQWLRRPGWPSLAVRWTDGAGGVTLAVSQAGAPYRLSLPVEVVRADGRRERHVVAVPASRRSRLRLALGSGAAVTAVVADPDGEVLAEVAVTGGEAAAGSGGGR